MDDLVDIPENPVPPGAVVTWLTAADGVRLRAARFAAITVAPRGTVCVFQGRGESIEKYFEIAEDLRARGFAVATLDWRGQGLSQRRYANRRRGHVASFAHYQRDLDVFMRAFALPECPPPFYALAHSMGGAILLHTVRRQPLWFERLVLSAPMVGLPGYEGRWPVKLFAAAAVALGFSFAFVPGGGSHSVLERGFAGNPLTGDAGRFARMVALAAAAPQLSLGAPTNGWLHAAIRAMEVLQKPAIGPQIRMPTLMFAPAIDKVVANGATAALARQMPTARLITLDGARHEILMERDIIRESFFAAFDAFVPGSPVFGEALVDPL